MKKSKIVVLIIIGIFVLAGAIYYSSRPAFKIVLPQKKSIKSAERFQKEYAGVREDNGFVYKTPEEIIDILENGTGLVYLGFPECPWCQKYAELLDNMALENNFDEIYYLNIKEMRAENTEDYQKIVALLGDDLDKDEEGNPRIFVPELIAVAEGEIVGRDNTSALNTSEDGTPSEWWTEEKVAEWEAKIKIFIEKIEACNTVCNG